MDKLVQLVGKERSVDDIARQLYRFASAFDLPAVGAVHLTCSDESERECTAALQRSFTDYLLPTLKAGERSHFRIANLGGRYEWGAIDVAEQHYATRPARGGVKLMLIKVNAHVGVESGPRGLRFGGMRRYETDSPCCGALHAVLGGAGLPFADDLRQALGCEGKDRVTVLLDEQQVDPAHRLLFAAAASARQQARRALLDLQDRRPQTPTLFLVVPCVTLNRSGKDGEIVCGVYHADWSSDRPVIEYQGLGDDPARYRLSQVTGAIVLEDDELPVRRAARDHRELVVQQWLGAPEAAAEAATRAAAGPAAEEHVEAAGRLDQVLEQAAKGKHHSLNYAKPMLMMLLHSLSFLDPVTPVVLLFGEGLLGIHHCHLAHRLSRRLGDDQEARTVLQALRARLDGLDPERARRAVDFLHAHLQRRGRDT